ncbi:MAG: hypothetical protein ACFFDW_17235, partial [Candidatus Thorarchaeota archaeon]
MKIMLAWIISLIVVGSILFFLLVILGLSLTKYLLISLINKKKYQVLPKEVTYLSKQPIINGELDENLINLPVRKFTSRIRLLPFQSSCKPKYRLAYGYDFFYVFIEIKAKTIVKRDRGYQNGDGFHMLLANPKTHHQLTDEFYVYGFSPNTDTEGNLEKYVWYHDVHVNLSKLGKDVQFAVKKSDGKIGYELLLPWKEVYPYHPWLMDGGIGFNLAFIKAQGSLFEYYSTLFDWRFQAENKKRNYILMNFEIPTIKEEMQPYVTMSKNSIQGSNILLHLATLSNEKKEEKLLINILSKNDDLISTMEFIVNCKEKLVQNSFQIPVDTFLPGKYTIQWQFNLARGEEELTILPIFNYNSLNDQINSFQGKISNGSYLTLKFKLDQINKEIIQIKWYENYIELMNSMIELLELIQKAEIGNDPLISKTGIFRRAFISNIDNSLQPYTISIPDNYNTNKKYPLIIFLHGSGVDDRSA